MYKYNILLIICIWLCCSGLVVAQEAVEVPDGQVSLVWDANKEKDLEGYRVHYGESSGTYDTAINVGNVTKATIKGLTIGKTYYFALTAHNTSGNESGYSIEVSTNAKNKESPNIPVDFKEVVTIFNIKAETVNIGTGL